MRDRRILQSGLGETFLEASQLGRHTIFTGGFPCQDLSIAGKQNGLDGIQSGLWRPYFGQIAITRPRWVVTENVGHTWRRWVPQLRRELHKIGYASLPLWMRASDLGADHRRGRVFLVANTHSELLRKLSRWWSGPGWEMAKEFAGAWDTSRRRLGSDDGFPAWVDRRRAIGNAIVPQCAEIIAEGIKFAEAGETN